MFVIFVTFVTYSSSLIKLNNVSLEWMNPLEVFLFTLLAKNKENSMGRV
jgi:hypothetical protein